MMYSPKKMNEELKNNNFSFKKKFGQNFIVDENIVDNIVKKANLDNDSLVIEIGPGSGSLTQKLSQSVKNVLCYEIDVTLKPFLNKMSDNVEIIYEDFLKRNVKKDLENYNYDKLYVVANLPYYITTPIIMKIIEDNLDVDKIVVMVQKEVGNRFKAEPNSKDYGSLSVFLNYYFDIIKLMDVSRNVFLPKPNVDSIVIELTKKEKIQVNNEELFFAIVRDSFKQKRKNLRNNLKNYDLEKIEKILREDNLDLTVRAEALTFEQFIKIANNYNK